MGDYVPCEITGEPTNDIHHINARGMGGSKHKDVIENLMGATRFIHNLYGDITKYKEFLTEVHFKFMEDQLPLIEYNPHHWGLDILLETKYKDRLKLLRWSH